VIQFMEVIAQRDRLTASGPTSGSHAVLTTVIGAGVAVLGCVIALAPALRVLGGGPPESVRFDWDAPHGTFSVGLDALSAFFLLPVLGLSALVAIYGGNYLLAFRGKKSIGGSWFRFNLFMVVLALAWVSLRGWWGTS
jgi:NADH:ubiquinone oxidoreductase subunit 5 (subunit L)/multisubunit Na+/H+ antiporter MnhA subunit